MSNDSQKGGGVRVLVAQDSPRVRAQVATLSKGGLWSFLSRGRKNSSLLMTYYYPYYFQSWRVTIPKTLGRTAKIRIVTGVNGLSRSTGPAVDWPPEEEAELGKEEVIRPRTSEAEAAELMQEYLDKFVARRYRPVRPPEVESERLALIYVPYYVYAREGQPIRKAALVEGLTGTVGKVKDVPEVFKAVTSAKLVTDIGKKGRS